MHQTLCEWDKGSGYDSVVQCLLSVCMLCLACAEGSGLHPQCWGNKGDAVEIVTTNLTGLYGTADSGVKQSLWKTVCVSSDMFSAYNPHRISCQSYCISSPAPNILWTAIFLGWTNLPGMGCWLFSTRSDVPAPFRCHLLPGHWSSKVISPSRLQFS